MITFDTSRFGKLTCEQREIVSFVHGIPGLETLTSFVLVDYSSTRPFMWLQSIQDPDIAFPLLGPNWIKVQYRYGEELNGEYLKKELFAKDERDLSIYCVVTIPNDRSKMTINLRAPLILNTKKGVGLQYILSEEAGSYPIREPLYLHFKEISERETRKKKMPKYTATVVRL